LWVAPAVAKAAMDSGVAQKNIEDFTLTKTRLKLAKAARVVSS